MRNCDTHNPFRDSLDSSDLNPAHQGGSCACVNRFVSLDCGNGARIKLETLSSMVDGYGTRDLVRFETRESGDETMELTVHAPSCLDGQDRHLLVQSAAHRLVVHLRLFRDSVLKYRAGARVGVVPHRYRHANGESGSVINTLMMIMNGFHRACGCVRVSVRGEIARRLFGPFFSLEFLLSYLRTSKAHVFSHELCTVYVYVD